MSLAATGALSQNYAWLVVLIVVAVTAFDLVDRLVPQKSHDRLDWWRTLWAVRRHGRRRRS
jgi:hypothetical protein